MARLYAPDRDVLPEADRRFYDHVVASRGKVSGPFTVLMHSARLGARVADVGVSIRFESVLPRSVTSLLALLVARHFRCPFEWAVWAAGADDAGLNSSVVEAVRHGQQPDELPTPLTIAYQFASELLGSTHAVGDTTYEAAAAEFGTVGVVELSAAIGYLALLTFPLNAFEVDVPPDLIDHTLYQLRIS